MRQYSYIIFSPSSSHPNGDVVTYSLFFSSTTFFVGCTTKMYHHHQQLWLEEYINIISLLSLLITTMMMNNNNSTTTATTNDHHHNSDERPVSGATTARRSTSRYDSYCVIHMSRAMIILPTQPSIAAAGETTSLLALCPSLPILLLLPFPPISTTAATTTPGTAGRRCCPSRGCGGNPAPQGTPRRPPGPPRAP